MEKKAAAEATAATTVSTKNARRAQETPAKTMAKKGARSQRRTNPNPSPLGVTPTMSPPARAVALHAQERTRFLMELFGGATAVADLLRVNKSQPSRWSRGQEAPSPEKARTLLDLDHVMARATLIWGPNAAREWMVGSNAFLDGARPVDVLRTRGSAEVIAALDAEDAGAFS